MVSVSNKDGFELICVVLSVGVYPYNLSGKFIETKALFEYGYSNYMIKKLREKNAIAASIDIVNATKETKNLDLLLCDDITATISQANSNDTYEPDIQLNGNIVASIYEGQVLGKIIYNIEGEYYSVDLKASHSVEVSSTFTLIIRIILIVFILGLLYMLLFDDKSGKKNKKNFKKNLY